MSLKPIIKWQGGKTQLLPELASRLPKNYNTYFEPFAGGLALLLYLQPEHAIVNDYNNELINLYKVVQSESKFKDLLEALHKYNDDYNQLHKDEVEDFYYGIRNQDRLESYSNKSDIDKAARFIFLNRTGYNGMHRVNSHNQNNVPFGKKFGFGSGGKYHDIIVDEDNLKSVHNYFKNHVEFMCGDYKECIDRAKEKDFVYLDPPYFPIIDESSRNTDYTDVGFSLKQQEELAQKVFDLNDKKVYVMESNSSVPKIRSLYGLMNIDYVKAKRSINHVGSKRGPIDEVLIRNYS